MATEIDIPAYFSRLGYKGVPQTDLETLQQLHYLHTSNIPFENLNPLLGLPVKLDLRTLQQKLVYDRRGRYCFEQNILFLQVLKSLGFTANGLTGRVILNQPVDAITGRTHMLVLIELNNKKYISDVGFGGQVPTGPLLLAYGKTQETPHENYRIVETKRGLVTQAWVKSSWRNLYLFDLDPQHFIDFKIPNWYTSTHPDSHFTSGLTIALTGDKSRYILDNNKFVIHHLKRKSEKQMVQNKDELLRVMKSVFNLTPPNTSNLNPILEDIVHSG